jgi:phosphoribosylformimino-5-aminoimidazole carboxamide ribotide isomerase
MQVIPVIDLLGGQVVRGVAGRRDEYRPIVSQIAEGSRPGTVARAFARQFGFDTAYVADLDAIMHGRLNVAAWQEIAGAGLKLWLDAGIGNSEMAWRVAEQLAAAKIAATLVVGLESLESEADFLSIGEMFGDAPPIFSLDLKAGVPLVRNSAWRALSPLEIALRAKSMGAQQIIVLDLADVGVNAGIRTLDLCRRIAALCETQTLIAGGGVRGLEDLRELAGAGCGGALAASALHDLRLTRGDVELAQSLGKGA